MKNKQRLNLLSEEEINLVYSIPKFTDLDRRHYFSLPEPILAQLKLHDQRYHYTKLPQKLYFILQFGYFKAKNLLFTITYKNVVEDVKFIMQHYFPNASLPRNIPHRKHRTKIKREILAFFGFQNNVSSHRALE